MKKYLIARLSEKSTRLGLATAISAITGVSVPDEKLQAASFLVTFVLGVWTAGTKDKGSDD